jgi:Ca2+-binding RTX toxin-like protein
LEPRIGYDDPIMFVVEAGTVETVLGIHPFDHAEGTTTYTVVNVSSEGWFKLGGTPLVPDQVLAESELGALSFTASAAGLTDYYLQFLVSSDDGVDIQTAPYTIVVVVTPGQNATYLGTPDNDVLDGGAGNDRIDGRAGADVMIGGSGNDTITVDNTGDRVVETTGIDTVFSSVSFSLANGVRVSGAVENLTLAAGNLYGLGNSLANVITGGAGNNIINGGLNDDRLFGGAGSDKLAGSDGNDTLSGGVGLDGLAGGSGRDVFVFDTAPNAATSRDRITDFNHADDTFQLENAIFTRLGMGAAHMLDPAFFHAGAAAVDANDYMVYNRANGWLCYDVNGSAAGGVFLLAVLANRPVLAANDFVVI